MLYLAYQAHSDLIEPAKTYGPPIAGDARARWGVQTQRPGRCATCPPPTS